MEVKKVPILLSLLATFALLFGGWFLYQKFQVENPIRQEIEKMTSANLSELQIGKEQINIEVTVTKPEKFSEEYTKVTQKIERYVPEKKLTVTLTNQDKELQNIWKSGQFALTEAVDLHHYSKIPVMVAEWKETYKLDLAISEMDDKQIYIFLKRGKQEYYAIVPREKRESEVA